MTDPAQRFLIVRLSSIGDIVHALPAAAALAETFPQAQIDWVVEKRHALLLEGNPHLHRIVELDTLEWRRTFDLLRNLARNPQECRRPSRRTVYDAAIDFQGLWKSAVVARLSHARERIGFAKRWMREPSAAVLYTQQVSPREHVHVVEENMALVEHLGAHAQHWQFPLPRTGEDDAYVEGQLAAMDAENFIIVNPGGGWRSKCWSPENYATLVRHLEDSRQEQILADRFPLGSASDHWNSGRCRRQTRALHTHHACAIHRPGAARPAFYWRRHRSLAPGGCRGCADRRHLRAH